MQILLCRDKALEFQVSRRLDLIYLASDVFICTFIFADYNAKLSEAVSLCDTFSV